MLNIEAGVMGMLRKKSDIIGAIKIPAWIHKISFRAVTRDKKRHFTNYTLIFGLKCVVWFLNLKHETVK